MSNTVDQTKRIFLLGSMGLIVLLVGGLIWAISSPPPPPAAMTFDDTDDPTTGAASSTVTVRVFGDFQCPACRAAEPGFTYLRMTYSDRVRIVWNDFPLINTHRNALVSANAARCAEEQGAFWEYHDRLYADQPTWSDLPRPEDQFVAYASALGLNTETFSSCLSNRTYEQKIRNDLREGERNGVIATPTFFINDQKIEGAIDNATWDREILGRLK